MLLLDSSLDSLMTAELRVQREADPATFAVALATDESPPSQRRFGGYRFQVTVLYVPRWWHHDSWDRSPEPPLDVGVRLLDICHSPGKDGQSLPAHRFTT